MSDFLLFLQMTCNYVILAHWYIFFFLYNQNIKVAFEELWLSLLRTRGVAWWTSYVLDRFLLVILTKLFLRYRVYTCYNTSKKECFSLDLRLNCSTCSALRKMGHLHSFRTDQFRTIFELYCRSAWRCRKRYFAEVGKITCCIYELASILGTFYQQL